MKTIKERYLYLLHQKDVTAYQVSAETGISNDVLSRLKNGKTKKVSNDTAKQLAKYFCVNKEWLVSGTGEMLNTQKIGDNSSHNVQASGKNININDIKEFARISENYQQMLLNKDKQIDKKDEQIDRLLAIIESFSKK